VYSEGAGIARAVPAAVAVPKDAEDVRTLVKWAASRKQALVPRGSGSGMAGGAVGDGVLVDLSRLTGSGKLDARAQRVRCPAGATRDAVDALAATQGLWLPVDPSSGKFCTVGGMVATNAAGAHSLRYGAMRSWVNALDCVFDDGSRAEVRRGSPPPAGVPALERFARDAERAVQDAARGPAAVHGGVRKESSGYAMADYARTGSLVDLLVGSEGTLAIVVGVELSLMPRPGATASLLAAFRSLDVAVEAAGVARDAGASACELLDRTFVEFVRDAGGQSVAGIPRESEAVLLVEAEGATVEEAKAAARELRDRLTEVAKRGRDAALIQLAPSPQAEKALWDLRHAASPILGRLDPHLKSMQFIEDAAVPPDKLAEYVRGVREALSTRGIRGVIFGHAGDAHVHVNPLIDVRRAEWRQLVDGLLKEVTALVVQLGGTLAGEHGDGRLRTPLLAQAWPGGATRGAFERIKKSFDPAGIFNPGVKVPLPGQRALGGVKYDPTLPALPAPARRALDRVEADRVYDSFRLELLSLS
jgi:FAD/FMN-containing dehydrogenase